MSLRDMAEDLWLGKTSTHDPSHHPFKALNIIEEITPRVAFYKSFSNLTAVRTDEGSVLIDTGSFHPTAHKRSFEAVRSWTTEHIAAAVYTHGHVDHAYGLPPFLEEARTRGWDSPDIVGHCHVRDRMDRYTETAGYNSVINERQFGHPIEWPVDPIYPTLEFDDSRNLEVGGVKLIVTHAKGETDDHAYIFLPEEGVLCTGDLFIWAAPNAGNPQKVQRYVKEWYTALRDMADLNATVLLPGHGLPVYGRDRVRETLRRTAEYLESLYTQALEMMNAGATVDELIHGVQPPAHLRELPYLQPVYDEPEFIVRTVHRRLGGWYCGAPCELKPAPRPQQAQEILALAGGVKALIARAEALAAKEDYRMAGHLADWAVEAEPANQDAHRVRARIYQARSDAETSTMSKGVFTAAAKESTRKSSGSD